ncbi:MAG: hypothetical protein J5603_04955 [Bacteroidales bacterium]|nr:hypothetical protein [Bacteroidales bacterium]MBR5720147.1 hypothetical protein [Bacteroidales bacterium]
MKWGWIKSRSFWICIVISALIWYIIYLSSDTVLKERIEVEYVDLPDSYFITDKSSNFINISLSVEGNQVNEIHSHIKNSSVIVSLANVKTAGKDKLVYTYQVAPYVKNQIGDMLKSSVNYSISTDSISLTFEKAISKKVPLKDDSRFEVASGYMLLKGSGFSCDSVTVTGLTYNVEQVDHVTLAYSPISLVSRSKTIDFNFEDYYHDFTVEPSVVTYSINVAEFTESSVTLKIEDFYDSNKLWFFPESVTGRFNVPLTDFNQISKDDFYLEVVIPEGNVNKALVDMKTTADNVIVIDVEPNTVEYLIHK